MQDRFVTDYHDARFTDAFRRYFAELGIEVVRWESLWDEMNHSTVSTILREGEAGTIGFVQYEVITSKSRFFDERLGFVREIWVEPSLRGAGHGRALLALAEEACREAGVVRMMLTTDTAEPFYLRAGYRHRADVHAKNGLCVYERLLTDPNT